MIAGKKKMIVLNLILLRKIINKMFFIQKIFNVLLKNKNKFIFLFSLILILFKIIYYFYK